MRAFGGDNRFVADYLSSEVLAALDQDARAFLHGAAVLGEFTAELCDGVLDRTDSAARLAELEHSNLFIFEAGARPVVSHPPAVRRIRGFSSPRSSRVRRCGFIDEPPVNYEREDCPSKRSATRPPPAVTSSWRSSWRSITCL